MVINPNMSKAVKLQQLKKIYSNGTEALKGIDLEVSSGDFFALLGPNGAGKSTAIGILSSLIKKTSGTVEVFGMDLDTDPEFVKSQIGLVPQEFNFNQFEPVEEIVINQAGFYGIPRRLAAERTRSVLKTLDLWDKRRSPARNLSGGMKRRLMIARALVHEPRLMILDEPTAGVDIEIRRGMWEFMQEINRSGTTIILTTHYLEEAENLCRNIAIIDSGEIVENSSMKDLLHRLHRQVFILTLEKTLQQLPVNAPFSLQLTDDHSLQVVLKQNQSLNQLFEWLNQQSINVLSMRNKQNRLEQFFMDRVQQRKNEVEA
jgi:ABC-2 type transport system ATP-binding protein